MQTFTHGEQVGEGNVAFDGMHKITVKNDVRHPVVIKISNATGDTLARVYVEPGLSHTVADIPDGEYTVRYATDPIFKIDCETVDWSRSASKFPGPKQMVVTTNAAGDRYSSILEYTLYTVPGGNVQPSGISLVEFNQD